MNHVWQSLQKARGLFWVHRWWAICLVFLMIGVFPVRSGYASAMPSFEMRAGTQKSLPSSRISGVTVKDSSVLLLFRDPLSGGFKMRALRPGSTGITLEHRETRVREEVRVVVTAAATRQKKASKKATEAPLLELLGWAE